MIIEPKDEVVNEEGEWVQCQVNEKDEWLNKDQLVLVDKYRPTIENLSIRKDPHVHSISLETLGTRDVVEAIKEHKNEEGDEWILINSKGKVGYLNKNYLENWKRRRVSTIELTILPSPY